uniref:Uncharacterized protein n=1 Tax=Capra hircus TaxID=9925 RepID=A0A8C2R0Z9_CAPHI
LCEEEERTAVIKNAAMSEEMRQDSVGCATQALGDITCRRASRPVLRRSVARSTTPPGAGTPPPLNLYCVL